MSDDPLISVVMPAYNAEAFIADAVASILAQNYQPLEVIVIDDGSTDNTAAIVASFGGTVHLHRQANAGPPVARNRGLDLASGEFVSFLDADDLFEPDMVARQLPRLRANSAVDIVLGQLRHFEKTSAATGLLHGAIAPSDDQLTMQLSCGLFRRAVFESVGRFDPGLWQCDDWDWFMRARELGVGMLLHRDVVVNHRLHGANITRDRAAVSRYQAMAFKLSLQRRRAHGRAAASLPPLQTFLEPDPRQSEQWHD